MMKIGGNISLFTLFFGLVCSYGATAVTVDHFNCKIALEDKENNVLAESSQDLFIPRKLGEVIEYYRDFGEVRYTTGNATMHLKIPRMDSDASLTLWYQHAFQIDDNNEVIKSAFIGCMMASASLPGMAFTDGCRGTGIGNPLDENNPDWAQVETTNGIPKFDASALPNNRVEKGDEYQARFHCDWIKTIK